MYVYVDRGEFHCASRASLCSRFSVFIRRVISEYKVRIIMIIICFMNKSLLEQRGFFFSKLPVQHACCLVAAFVIVRGSSRWKFS